jgi:hypothetical protein
MHRGRSRWLVRLGLLAVVAVAVLVWLYDQHRKRGLTVENRSGQPIAVLEITAAGETSTFRDVPDGGQVSAPLGDSGGGFKVDGRFPDGTRISGRFAPSGGPDLVTTGLVVVPGGQIMPRKTRK